MAKRYYLAVRQIKIEIWTPATAPLKRSGTDIADRVPMATQTTVNHMAYLTQLAQLWEKGR
jgi:hypothetical protein